MNKLNKQIITGMLGLFALTVNGAETGAGTGGSDSSYVTTLSNWSIEPTRSCNTFTISLPSPTLDIGCNLDNDSGNPSTWFNPLASCDLNFDMIGLPTLGDIAAGLTGAICGEIKALKEKTIDQVIDEINNQIPDQIFDDINLGGNVNDRLNSGTGSDGTPIPPSVGNGGTQPTPTPTPTEPELCYTRDSSGNTITATATATGGMAPYTFGYVLNPGNITNTTGVFPGLANGGYSICAVAIDAMSDTCSFACDSVFIGNPPASCNTSLVATSNAGGQR